MDHWAAMLAAGIPAIWLVGGLVPARWANRQVPAMRRLLTGLVVVAGLLSASAVALLASGASETMVFRLAIVSPIQIGVYFDSLAAVMILLVTFIGGVIVRYSLRYLDGDPRQGRFLKWISFTLGSVMLLVVASNLLLLTLAWIATSMGLHQLLTHYRDRPEALLAARKKFLISRLGDGMLIAALILTYRQFGSWDYQEIFSQANALREGGESIGWTLSAIASLFVIGAMTKSAQFPLHSWLPDTMETPTPVSALMHAGIINAGGFLVIRLSPLVSLSAVALDFLALVGAFTALFGAVVMMTQTSIKRSLAYSTVAQMGFMMLQCGLGAFSAALMHIVAHSLYKAHAFLSAGSVMDAAAGMQQDRPSSRLPSPAASLLVPLLLAAGIVVGNAWLLGLFDIEKRGALLLGMILILALANLFSKAAEAGQFRAWASAIVIGQVAAGGYCVAYLAFAGWLESSMPKSVGTTTWFDGVLMLLVAVGFVGVFALQWSIPRYGQTEWMQRFYSRAYAGFNMDIPLKRVTQRLWGGPGLGQGNV